MAEEELKKLLKSIGFTEYKSSVFLFMTTQPKALNAKQIAYGADIPLARIYSVLLELEKEGLVRRIPGKIQLYTVVGSKEATEKIFTKQEKKMKEKLGNFKKLSHSFKKELSHIEKERKIQPNVTVRYHEKDPNYWLRIAEIEGKVNRGEVRRILDVWRPIWGLLDEELNKSLTLRKNYLTDLKLVKRGVIQRYLYNPKMIVHSTAVELKNKEKIVKSLSKFLNFCSENRNEIRIKITHTFENMLVEITPETVILEFFAGQLESGNAIELNGELAVKDFTIWFDAMYGKDDPKGYEKLKKEIKKQAREMLGIALNV